MSQFFVQGSGGGGGGVTQVLATSGSSATTAGTVVTIRSPPYQEISAPATLQANNGYFLAGDGTYTLPASAGLNNGDLVEVIVTAPAGDQGFVTVQAGSGQKINNAKGSTSTGGQALANNQGDTMSLRFRVLDTSWWSTANDQDWFLV